MLHPPR